MTEFKQSQLFSCGQNIWYQNLLGKDLTKEFVSVPSCPKFNRDVSNDIVVKIALGAEFSLCLMKSGRVFAGGLSSYGQLAMYPTSQCSLNFITRIFELVTTLEEHKIVDIACGAEHSCFLTDTGRVFLSGYNYHQEIDDSGNNYYFPLEVDMDMVFGSGIPHEPIIKIYAGSWHTCLLTEKGNLYIRGAHSEHMTSGNSNLQYVRINESKKN